ncbi:class I SAM-dependent methyltransferase [Microvirga flavescens]|uniref:class I SAM-dependent methyltransferase n=1 Tax=Microvirga flavescens TaxID=2249811 RepID=UPI000DDBB1A9|nr:class I SAM-dependent methyltransferase [Microvirga flavescens]
MLTKDELEKQIAARRPWYQRIEFPEHGVSTTDDPDNAMLDAAWDNVIGGISLEEAAIRRPQPKWNEIQPLMPDPAGLDCLEIGSNCGFFSLEFARKGARSVLGLDVAPHWLDNARWAANTLGLKNVEFRQSDFMLFHPDDSQETGLLSNEHEQIKLPNDRYDLVFMSTVLDHLFFPLFAIYKMIRISRRWVIIDVPHFNGGDDRHNLLNLSVSPDCAHHGFVANQGFMRSYIRRLGVPEDDLRVVPYNDGNNVLYVIDTRRKAGGLVGA